MIDSGVKVSGYIRPIGEFDTYPTHLDIFGKGGIHSTVDKTVRNLITEPRRSLGMLAYTADDSSMYGLFDGLSNNNWVKLFEYKDNKINFNIGCDEDYILVGTRDKIAKPTPALIDVRLDILGLRHNIAKFRKEQRELHTLPERMLWIGNTQNKAVPNKTIAVDNMPQLAAAQFPEPTGTLTIPLPNPTFNPLSGFDWLMSGAWLPQIFAGSPGKLDPTVKNTVLSSSLAMTQIKTAQAIERLDNASFIVKSRTLSFTWPNPAMSLIPDAVKSLYDLHSSYTFKEAQALDEIGAGLLYNNAEGNLSKARLSNKHIWLGQRVAEDDNIPVEVSNLLIDNLPSLGTTDVPTPTGGFVGKVWEGTSSGRPEESSIVGEMFADITALNAKFLAGKFVMNTGLTASYPRAQFLDALTAGALVKTSSAGDGKLESVVINQDQVLMGGANNVPESRARIGVENLPLLADKKLWSGNADSIPQSITAIDISNLPNLANNNLWVGGEDNRPIAKVNIDISNLPNLEQNKLWIGDAGNRPVAQSTLNIDNLPNLTNNRVWQGNAQGRPEEVELNFAPVDATYIIKQPNAKLTNAQVLSELGVGMAKIVAGGAFAIAIPDEDYATKETLEQIKAETEEFKNQAANSAEQAATSAEEASASATEAATSATEAAASATEATGAATEATAAAAEATGAAAAASGSAAAAGVSAAAAAASALAAGASAGSASSSASDASSSASNAHNSAVNSASSASQSLQYLNKLLNTGINLVGDVLGSGPLKDPITLTFKANPIFTGTGSMTIPVGTTAERPSNPTTGMVRLNTDF